MKSIDEVEKDLVDASAVIGGIHECNNRFTYGLARLIWERGRSVEDLTLKELILLNEQYGARFNEMERAAEV